MMVMHAVVTRRAWAAIAGPLKTIDCLLEPKLLGIARGALGKHRQGGSDVIGCPSGARCRPVRLDHRREA
jgi:hypothetical protein